MVIWCRSFIAVYLFYRLWKIHIKFFNYTLSYKQHAWKQYLAIFLRDRHPLLSAASKWQLPGSWVSSLSPPITPWSCYSYLPVLLSKEPFHLSYLFSEKRDRKCFFDVPVPLTHWHWDFLLFCFTQILFSSTTCLVDCRGLISVQMIPGFI